METFQQRNEKVGKAPTPVTEYWSLITNSQFQGLSNII